MKSKYLLLLVLLTALVGCMKDDYQIVNAVRHCTTPLERQQVASLIAECAGTSNLGDGDQNVIYACQNVAVETFCPLHHHYYRHQDDVLMDDFEKEVTRDGKDLPPAVPAHS